MLKKCKVVMLPVNNKRSNIFLFKDNRLYYENIKSESQSPNAVNQHLYIVSNDKIKMNDKFIYNNDTILTFMMINKVTDYYLTFEKFSVGDIEDWDPKYCNKIIATTDDYIATNNDPNKDLPSPSQLFINKYIEQYNKGNIITDIIVEYVDNSSELKVNPKGSTITIKPVKGSWNKEEVKQLLWLAYSRNLPAQSPKDIKESLIPEFNKWIEENL